LKLVYEGLRIGLSKMDVLTSLGAILDEKSSRPSENFYVIRAPLTNADECHSFVKRFGEASDSRWIVRRTTETDPVR